MKLEMERAGRERPFPAVTQPPQSRLRRGKTTELSGVGNPLSGSGPSVLAGRSKPGLSAERSALDITAPPVTPTSFSAT